MICPFLGPAQAQGFGLERFLEGDYPIQPGGRQVVELQAQAVYQTLVSGLGHTGRAGSLL